MSGLVLLLYSNIHAQQDLAFENKGCYWIVWASSFYFRETESAEPVASRHLQVHRTP